MQGDLLGCGVIIYSRNGAGVDPLMMAAVAKVTLYDRTETC